MSVGLAEPRNRPPELATNGLRDKPTLINNVETFAWGPGIVLNGGGWYRDLGVPPGKGRRLFSISGDVARPGVYEMAIGAPLDDLLALAGGMRDPGQPLKAIAPSGPSGGFLPPQLTDSRGQSVDLLALPLDIDAFRRYDLMLGAGLVVYDASRDMADQAVNAVAFYRSESCGKCVPCRIGSEKLLRIGEGLLGGAFNLAAWTDRLSLIDELAEAMALSAICGLGVVAPAPLTSVARHFPDDVARHLLATPRPIPI
jgi:NADH:ubiquinone oxidoreductase subunit F (NADH-binding)